MYDYDSYLISLINLFFVVVSRKKKLQFLKVFMTVGAARVDVFNMKERRYEQLRHFLF